MPPSFYAALPHRALIKVEGDDRLSFLQGLTSLDANKLPDGRALYGALLNPQGRFLFDFFALEKDGSVFLETEAMRRDELIRILSRYKLRAKVSLSSFDDLKAFAALGEVAAKTLVGQIESGVAQKLGSGVVFVDPRLAEAGARLWITDNDLELLKATGLSEQSFADWDFGRIALGIPDGGRDIKVEKALPLEAGFDELHGVDWEKGCYMGQEQTARCRYRGGVKQRLVVVAIEGPTPEIGAILALDGAPVGEMRSSCGTIGLAMVQIEALEKGGKLTSGPTELSARKPAWAIF